MPRDSNGNFALNSGYQAVLGETIQPSQHNPPLEDIAQALTDSLPRSGSAPMGGPLRTVSGSASSPAIRPNGNSTIGIYFTDTGIGIAGTLTGARVVGEIVGYAGVTPPSLWVMLYGQTLSRAAYPDLWTLAQAQIASGINVFFNNGNGSTTFGVADYRGRVSAGKDDMGGSAANRLTNGGAGIFGETVGATGGSQTFQLQAGQLPPVSPTFTGNPATITVTSTRTDINVSTLTLNSGGTGTSSALPAGMSVIESSGSHTPSGTISALGAGNAISLAQPTIIENKIMYAGA